MMRITPSIEQDQARKLLSKRNVIWSSKRDIVKTELLFLPLYVFTFEVSGTKERLRSESVSVDGIKGEFAFFMGQAGEKGEDEDLLDEGFMITEEDALGIALGEYQRILMRYNLRQNSSVSITGISRAVKVFYPYWAGYFRRKDGFDFEIIDAVEGSKQGVRMRPVFIDLLLHAQGFKNLN